MATASYGFTPEECERLFKIAKTVATRISWKHQDANTLLFHAKVVTVDGVGLDLQGHWQKIWSAWHDSLGLFF
jgi:hypothetical protein